MYQNKADTVRVAAKATGFSASVIDKTYEVVLVQNRAFPVNDGLEDQRLTYTIARMVARVITGKRAHARTAG
jgi:hypothetical protein